MGVNIDNNIDKKFYSYYLFQKKIDCFINFKNNPFYKSNGKDIKTELFYVINKKYINYWKVNTDYNKIKDILDQIIIDDDIDEYVNKIKSSCSQLRP